MNGRRLARGHSLEGARFGAAAAPKDGYYAENWGEWVYRYNNGRVTLELSPTSKDPRVVEPDSKAYRAIVLAIHSHKALGITATDLRILRSRWKPPTTPLPRPYKGEPAGSSAAPPADLPADVHEHQEDAAPSAPRELLASLGSSKALKWGLGIALGILGIWAVAPTRPRGVA